MRRSLTFENERVNLIVKSIPPKGFGLFTVDGLSEGEFSCLYHGQTITQVEAEKIWKERSDKGNGNYILVLKEHYGRAGESVTTIIDPTTRGNVGRFMSASSSFYPVDESDERKKITLALLKRMC